MDSTAPEFLSEKFSKSSACKTRNFATRKSVSRLKGFKFVLPMTPVQISSPIKPDNKY